MPEFVYQAYQSPGQRIDGRLNAESERTAAELLLQQGLQPIEIRALGVRRPILSRLLPGRRLGGRERAQLTRQLADLVSSGMPMLSALDLLEGQCQQPRIHRSLMSLQKAVRAGKSLGEAMETLPKDFNKIQVSLVKAGEGAGLLATVLNQIADLEEGEDELRNKVRSALTYPAITAVVGLLTVLVILNFVIPRLSSIFDQTGQTLPLITRILLSLSTIAQWIWKYGLPILLAGLLAMRLASRSTGWIRFRDSQLLKLPKLGSLILTVQTARFARILGSLLRNGVAMVPALTVTTETLDSSVVRDDLRQAVNRVSQGERLGDALAKEKALSGVVTSMISVGETTGNLETILERISTNSGRDADRQVKVLVGLVEPVLILLMGVFVAFIVAAVIIPIFQVNLTI
ncbi:type II secretion system F family protein [Candidatus Eisenbacteria bacterium]|uniref:Type II secretion system F family protein n=1 Tax=Eiseniibacteriota bacterium TaxID=2212470 RepID=A0ABV6YLG7_UNCEI